MTREIKRAYRILGLRAGASSAEVKAAYRDLAQVWHPDRFAHSERLHEKAQQNLKRINEAYQTLQDYDPPAGGEVESVLSSTMSAVLNMGDMLQSRTIQRERERFHGHRQQPDARGRRRKVVGLEEWEKTGVLKKKRVRRRRPWLWVVGALVVLAAVALLLVVMQIR